VSAISDQGYFVRPTVLTDTTPDLSVVSLGPVVRTMPFDDDLDRIARTTNDTTYGLAASIWTRDLGLATQARAQHQGRHVWINPQNFGDPALPFGGYKQSGRAARRGSRHRTPHKGERVAAALR